VVTNSVPQSENVITSEGKLDILDVSPLLSESIRRTHNGESFNILFGEVGLSEE
jgi:ribose-phosphate pyrophosphokinase